MNNLASLAGGNNVRLNDYARAVVKNSGGSNLVVEEQIKVRLLGRRIFGSVNRVSNGISAELLLEDLSAFGHLSAGIFANDLHASAHVRLQQLGSLGRLAFVLLEETGSGGSSEPAHLEAGKHKSTLVNVVNNLASVNVSIGLNHSEGALLSLSEAATSESITVISQFELSGENGDNSAEEEFVHGHVSAGHALQEHLSGFEVEHLDGLVAGEVGKEVLADKIGLLVEPVAFKDVAFLGGSLTHFI